MNRQEPYIGMPIILASFDEDQAERHSHQSQQNQQNQQIHHSHQSQQNQQTTATSPMNDGTVCTEIRQPMVLAMAYVPWQRWQETYPLEEGFTKGTIFPELYFPFEGYRQGGMCK